jgi:UDP-2,4-diacetamido-2,4,6-trideoxy-beta-L-altropyranose hydrolase
MKITFRVDASVQIVSGYVIRCLTLAQELCDRNAGCTFICRKLDGNPNSLIKERGFTVFTLPNDEEGYT